ncbi:MAG: response regulator [Aquabacterium sp.]
MPDSKGSMRGGQEWQVPAGLSASAPMSAYRRLMALALLLPVLLMLGMMSWMQYRAQRSALLVEFEGLMQRRINEVDGITTAAEEHVINMRHWMEGDLAMAPPSYPADLHKMLTPRLVDGQPDGYTLDELPIAARDYLGQFMWVGANQPTQADLNRFAYFSGPASMAHALKPYFAWSYFFSAQADVFIVYPWTPVRTLVDDAGSKSLRKTMKDWLGYDVFKMGEPARNPSRSAYWVEPYVDAGGKGLMVSHAAPVSGPDGSFRGMVGTDVLLDTLQDMAMSWHADLGRWWVMTEGQMMLADSRQPLLVKRTDTQVPPLTDRLPARVTMADVKAAVRVAPKSVETRDGVLIATRSKHAPWLLLHHVPEQAIWAALWPNMWPYAQMILLVLAFFALGLLLVQRKVLGPALAVLDFLLRRMRHQPGSEPRVGALWRPVLQAVQSNFEAQKEMERQQRRSEALKSAVVDNALFAIVTTDEAGHIVEFNPAAEQMLGMPRGQAIGRLVSDVMVPPRYRQAHLDGMSRVRSGQPTRVVGKRLEMEAMRADGTEMPVEMVLARSEIDGEVFYSALLSDLTERKQVNAEVERQREALRQSEKLTAMGSLLAGVAHELNNPLAILMGRATLLENKTQDEALRSDAQRIREAAERCARIVKTFLNMARSQGGERRMVQLNDMVRGAVDLMAYALRTGGVEVSLELSEAMPELQADGDQIGQIILNLLVNAQQAPGVTRVRVSSGIEAGEAGQPAVAWLRVCDNGPGVPVDLAQRIFDPFFTTKPVGSGTGLGLSVSRAIARDHGGDLSVEAPKPGCGATFVLRLPLCGAVLQTPSTVPDEGDGAPSSAFVARVLVVDDEPDLADVMRAMLESQGYEVLSAESGQVALEILAEAHCDAVLSDLRMPVMDGPALWREVVQRHPGLARRMIFVTGDTLSAGAREFLRETGCACIEKPFSQAELLAKVKAALQD